MRRWLFASFVLVCPAIAFALPRPDHVVVVVEENHSADEVLGSSSAPYINSLALGGMNFMNFHALAHPSQPNYLMLFSGSDQGVTDDNPPAGVPFATPNLAAALRSKGLSFAGYSESLPSTGYTGETSGDYARKHNPWVNWQTTSGSGDQLPSSVNLSLSSFPSDFTQLPTVSFVVPNLQHDMHDGSISAGDSWLSSHLGAYNTWAKAHNSLLVVTWDEDDYSADNHISTIFSGAMVKQGTNSNYHDHLDLLKTLSDMYGAAPAGGAAGASDIGDVWTSTTTVNPPPPTNSGGGTSKTIALRKGANGYAVGHDTYLTLSSPSGTHGGSSPIVTGGDSKTQAIVRFDSLIGSGPNQIPKGSTISSAKLTLQTATGSADGSKSTFSAYRMLKSWSESSTWNSLVGGISADGSDAVSAADSSVVPGSVGGLVTFDVTKSVQAWANGSSDFGWAILTSGTDAWRFDSNELGTVSLRPQLKVTFTSPAGASATPLSAIAVPEPVALLLLPLAVASAIARRARATARP